MSKTTALAFLFLAAPLHCYAGMPIIRVNEVAKMRIEAISFFIVLALLLTLVVKWLWNYLARELGFPTLSYRKALAVVVVWGALFSLVLTMISGARELMTPGAWQANGTTYTLQSHQQQGEMFENLRRRQIERLRAALWHYAHQHQGQLPADNEVAIGEDIWQTIHHSRVPYNYRGGLRVDIGKSLVAYEPGVFGGVRYALFSDGSIDILETTVLNEIIYREWRDEQD